MNEAAASAAPESSSQAKWPPGYLWLAALTASVLLLDQITKQIVVATMTPESLQDQVVLIPGFLYFTHLHNYGAAWGILQGQTFLLSLLAFAATIAIIWFRRHLYLHRLVPGIAFGLILGGILGNLIDRVRLGYVVDFIDVWLGSYNYPVFNIADSGITVGTGIYIFWSFVFEPKLRKEESSASKKSQD